MEGRKHTGVVLTTASNADAPRADAWEEPWRSARIPAAVESGAVDHGVGFRIASGYDLGGATHVAIYETQRDDVAAAAREVEAAGSEKAESYTKIFEYGPVTRGRTVGIVLVYTDCDDPAEEDAFNQWYSGHLHHTVESIDFFAATRYVSNDPGRTPSRYLVIYESRSDDPAKVQKDGVDWWVKTGLEGPKGMVLRNEVPAERVD